MLQWTVICTWNPVNINLTKKKIQWPHTVMCVKAGNKHNFSKKILQRDKFGTIQYWLQGNNQVWVARHCIAVEGLNSQPMVYSEPWKGVRKWGSCDEDKNNSKFYHLQMGQDAQVRWSSVCAGLCIHLPALQSSVGGAPQTDHTRKRM